MNFKVVYKSFILFIIGIILIINGVLGLYYNSKEENFVLSDEYVIKRAKELGMIEISKAYREYLENNKDNIEKNTTYEKEKNE